MSSFYLGVYWHSRQLTMRAYADATHRFIHLLRTAHPAFALLEWVGDRPGTAVRVASDLSNLDELIYHHAWDKTRRYEHANPDGAPAWESVSKLGYGMDYSTGGSKKEGYLFVSISAGITAPEIFNSVLIEFPAPDHPKFFYREFFDDSFLTKLFSQCVHLWRPESGRVTSHSFNQAVAPASPPVIGWLTYVRDPRAAALRNSPQLKNLIFETTPDGGTLISLGRTPISPDNAEQVEQARLLRQILLDERLVQK